MSDYQDLVKRLRDFGQERIIRESADAIETLEREMDKAMAYWGARNAESMARAERTEAALKEVVEAMDEAHTCLSWMLLEGMDEAIPQTCPDEYKRTCDATERARAVLEKIEGEGSRER